MVDPFSGWAAAGKNDASRGSEAPHRSGRRPTVATAALREVSGRLLTVPTVH
jgi:hypothetical protein